MSPPDDRIPAQDPERWARTLAAGWEKRARSPSRDFFVASFENWQDPATWERIARQEIELMLAGLAPDWLAEADVLEIGCGSGRLTPFLLEQVRSYTGFDIAPGMVEAARDRCAGEGRARFLVGDGLRVPVAARDQEYRLVLTLAVFIHCPKNVIERNIKSAWQCVAPGGQLRFQVLGDPSDRTGIVGGETVPTGTSSDPEGATGSPLSRDPATGSNDHDVDGSPTPADPVREEAQSITDSRNELEVDLSSESHYMGHAFGYEETREMVARLTPGSRLELYRGHPYAIYGMAANDS